MPIYVQQFVYTVWAKDTINLHLPISPHARLFIYYLFTMHGTQEKVLQFFFFQNNPRLSQYNEQIRSQFQCSRIHNVHDS